MNSAYLEQKVRIAKLFKQEAKMPETREEIMDAFCSLLCDLSPENLTCDGELSGAAIRAKHKQIMDSWAYLESKLGEKVREEEVYYYEMMKMKYQTNRQGT